MFRKKVKPLNLCNRLQKVREEKGISLEQLSFLTGISKKTLSFLEGCPSGSSSFVPSTYVSLLLSVALDCEVSDLFYFEVYEV